MEFQFKAKTVENLLNEFIMQKSNEIEISRSLVNYNIMKSADCCNGI